MGYLFVGASGGMRPIIRPKYKSAKREKEKGKRNSLLPQVPFPLSFSKKTTAQRKAAMVVRMEPTRRLLFLLLSLQLTAIGVQSGDNNGAFSPCSDTKVRRKDGFSFGIAFASRTSFFPKGNTSAAQLSPCDSRLDLSGQSSQIAVFRPKVDEISLLTVNASSFSPDNYGGYMVAFAGRKYAARSLPAFVANGTYTVTSFTLVLEFQKGRLQNLYWKRDGCAKCSKSSNFVCLNNVDCAIKTSSCKNHGGNVDCSLGIQLGFSGTDKHLKVLNSWYEVSNLRQYSLYGLYSNLVDSLTSQYNSFF